MEEWLAYLNELHPMSAELSISLIQASKKEIYRKNRIIMYPDQICDWIGYIEKGLVIAVIPIEDQHERVVQFYRGDQLIFPVHSFHAQAPTRILFKAEEESVIRKLNRSDLRAICEKHPHFYHHLYRMSAQQYQNVVDHLLLSLHTTQGRFTHFLNTPNWLLQDLRIKDYMLADYLGIDKATFSRYRKQFPKQDTPH